MNLKLLMSFLLSTFAEGWLAGKTRDCELPEFGHPMKKEFLLDPNFIQLNHGSYGSYPKSVQIALHQAQLRAERNPEVWIRKDSKIEMAKVRAQLAAYLNCDPQDIVLVPNTTGGINAVFRSLIFRPGDQILHFNTVYGAMGALLKFISDQHNGTVRPLEFISNYPVGNDDLVTAFETFVNRHHSPPNSPIRIALIDHISSVPAVILPLQKLIPILKSKGILVIIDGAHGIGQVPIDLQALDPDFYVTDCHKWLYAPRGSAVLYVNKAHQSFIHPPHISFDYNQSANYQAEFFWTGTIDYSNFMSIPAALAFRSKLGESRIRDWNHGLAVQGGEFLAQRFGTQVLQTPEQIGYMVDVALPINNPDQPGLTSEFWTNVLLTKFSHIYCAPHKHNGKWWIRVSAQIYNELADFEVAANVFNKICEELNSKGPLSPFFLSKNMKIPNDNLPALL